MTNNDVFDNNIFTGQNVALGKPTSQFPVAWFHSFADNAVDGHIGSDVEEGRCAHPSIDNNNPAWWMVDLKDVYTIIGIRIFNRNRSNTQTISCKITNTISVNLFLSQIDVILPYAF